MSRSLPLNAAFATLLLLLVVFAVNATAQVIRVEPTTIDFGTMKQRETQTATVTITNDGAGRLELGEASADCGCTVPKVKTNILGPGESTTMEIQFNSKNFNGPVVKLVTIHSNDPNAPRSEVMVTAKILASMVVDPQDHRLTFKDSPQGKTQMLPITFTSVGPEPLKITAGATSNKGLFHMKVINGKGGNPLVSVVEVTVPANTPQGNHTDMGRIRSNVPGMESENFYFSSKILSELTLDIEAVKFRFKKDLEQTITITPTSSGTKFKVTGVEIDMPEIKATFENMNGKEAQVHLTGKVIATTDPRAISTKGRIKGTLLIHTDLESLPTIEVPVSYLLRM